MEDSDKRQSASKKEQPNKGDASGKKPSESEEFSCCICPYTTKFKQFLNIHYKVNHRDYVPPENIFSNPEVKIKDKYFRCKQCSFRCPRRSTLRDHMLIHQKENTSDNNSKTQEETTRIPVTNIDLPSTSTGMTSIVHQKIEASCSRIQKIEGASTSQPTEKPKPQKIEESTKNQQTKASKSQPTEKSSKTQKVETPSKSKQVGECSKSGQIKKSSTSQEAQESFYCNQCDYMTINASLYREHVAFHAKDVYFYICTLCDFFTPDVGIHIEHMKQHEKGGIKCEICGEMFFKTTHLQRHKMMHETKPLFMCDVCGRLFTQKQYLLTHMHTHTQDKPAMLVKKSGYLCKTCIQVFPTKAKLMEHWKVHIEQNAAICAICEKKFVSEDILKKHVETHIKPEPKECVYFECPFCQVNFTDYFVLEKHLEIHPDE